MKEKNERSLYGYTALIFLFALIIIIVSFFGQGHLQRTDNEDVQPSETPITAQSGIGERASVLSDENMRLTAEKSQLEEELNSLKASAAEKDKQIADLGALVSSYDSMLAAEKLLSLDNISEASAVLAKINPELLSGDSLEFYNKLNDRISGLNIQ